jgi:hypothetical protein
VILTLLFCSSLCPATQIFKKLLNYPCLETGFCTLFLEVLWCMFILSLLFL